MVNPTANQGITNLTDSCMPNTCVLYIRNVCDLCTYKFECKKTSKMILLLGESYWKIILILS